MTDGKKYFLKKLYLTLRNIICVPGRVWSGNLIKKIFWRLVKAANLSVLGPVLQGIQV